MSEETKPIQPLLPLTPKRVLLAFNDLKIVPFMSIKENQVAVMPGGMVLRVVVPEKGPAQGFGLWMRTPNVTHAGKVADFVSRFNLTTYLPRLITESDDDGNIHVTLEHVFSWPGLATDNQVKSELLAFVGASMAAIRQLNTHFPDPWTRPKKAR